MNISPCKGVTEQMTEPGDSMSSVADKEDCKNTKLKGKLLGECRYSLANCLSPLLELLLLLWGIVYLRELFPLLHLSCSCCCLWKKEIIIEMLQQRLTAKATDSYKWKWNHSSLTVVGHTIPHPEIRMTY